MPPGLLGWPAARTCPSMARSLSIFIFLNFSSGEVCATAHAITQLSEISHTCRQSTALLLLGDCSEGGFHYHPTPTGREVEQFSCLAKNRQRDFPFSLWPVQWKLSTLIQATLTAVCLFPSPAFSSSSDLPFSAPTFHTQPPHLFLCHATSAFAVFPCFRSCILPLQVPFPHQDSYWHV